MRISRIAFAALITSGSFAVACGSAADQELEGHFGEGWDSPPVRVIAKIDGRAAPTSPDGEPLDVVSADVAADGSFLITLPGETKYQLSILQADGSRVLVILPADEGGAHARLEIHGGTERFDMGRIDLVSPFDSTTFVPMSLDAPDIGTTQQGLTLAPGPDGGAPDPGSAPAGGASGGDDDGDNDGDNENEAETCDDDSSDGEAGELQADQAAVPQNVPPQGLGSCDDDSSSDDDSDDDSSDDD